MLLFAIVLDVDGWRSFVLSIIVSLFQLAILAALPFILLIVLVIVLQRFLGLADISENALLVCFLIAMVIALSLVDVVFHRSIDIYDVGLAVLLVFALGIAPKPLGRWYQNLRRYVQPIWLGNKRGRPPTRHVSHRGSGLYTNLLAKVRGDREMAERLIAYERTRAPHANREQLIQRAIDSWERDNR